VPVYRTLALRGIHVLGRLVTWTTLPEAKGKSLGEIESENVSPAEKMAA
jgi:hypothetical protein